MKNKLWAGFLIFLICFCFIYFKYAYDDAKTTAIKDLNEKQMSFAIQASIGINDLFDNWTNLLISITQVPAIVNLDEEGKNYISFTYEINKADITAVTRVDANGKIIFTAPFNPKAIGQDISGQKHIQEVMRSYKPAVSDVFKSVQGFDMVALHVPVMKNGKFHGTLGIGINFRNIAKEYIESIRIGKTGYAWMISRDGTELYSPVPSHTGKSVFENYKKYPFIITMADEMVKGKQGITTYSFDQISEQKVKLVKKHAVYMPIHIGQIFWSIVIESSENEILSSLIHFRNKLILIIGLFFAGGVIFSFFGLKGWFIVREEQKRKRAEEALNKTQQLLVETGSIGKVGGWEINIDTGKLTWTEELYNIHEVDLSYDPTVEKAVHFYTPDSRPIIEKAVQRAIDHGESYEVELEIITAKGNLRCVHAVGKADLEHHRVYGFFQDITELKRT
ncbi:MAG: Cache 3/Cache 2 fusion domain-containing protein, partial [Proteobacteria bacterium]|nr:Cache 3/Cache 2 fusion domain-containing protein [Pseudomonadota bacterium]